MPEQRHNVRISLLGVSTLLMGMVNLLSALTPSEKPRLFILRRFVPLALSVNSRLLTALAGIFLLMLARGIFRHKRHAWRLVAGLLAMTTVFHLVKGLDYEESILSLAVLIGFVVCRKEFKAISDPVSVQQGVKIFFASILWAYAYGVLGFYLMDRHFHEHFSFAEASWTALKVYFTFDEPPLPHGRLARWFLNSIYSVAAAAMAFALWLILKPVVHRKTVHKSESEKAAVILERYGKSSLARFTIWDDKNFFFTGDGQAYCAYKVVGDIALVLGDPIGPDDMICVCIEEFAEFCAENDWIPAYYQILAENLEKYKSRGYVSLKIGEEAIVDLRDWSLQGGSRKNMRNLVNRFVKLSYGVQYYEPPLSDDLIRELRAVSDEWLKDRRGAEKTFSLGNFTTGYVRETPVMAVSDPFGKIVAFANIIPEYSRNEATIDMMRRRKDAERGVMEFLFIQLTEHFKLQGYDTFNLGLAPLSGVGMEKQSSALEKGMSIVYQHFNHFYSFRGLRLFKEKFDPVWEPRYLVYKGSTSLPRVAYAVLSANSGGRLAEYVVKQRKKNLAEV